MTVVSASEMRSRLAEILDLVTAGEEITIERHGRPVAVVVSPDALRSRRADVVFAEAESIRVLLDDAKGRTLDDGWISAESADELLAEVREGRRRS